MTIKTKWTWLAAAALPLLAACGGSGGSDDDPVEIVSITVNDG